MNKPDAKNHDPNRGLPESNNLPLEDQPSPAAKPATGKGSVEKSPAEPLEQMSRGQAAFMKPEPPGKDSNLKSGAI